MKNIVRFVSRCISAALVVAMIVGGRSSVVFGAPTESKFRLVPQISLTNPAAGRIAPDGSAVITWGGGTSSYWNRAGERLATFPLRGVAAISSNGRLAEVRADGSARIIDVDTGRDTYLPDAPPISPHAMIDAWFSRDGDRLYSVQYEYQPSVAKLSIWNVQNASKIADYEGRSVAWSRNQSHAALVTNRGQIIRIDLASNTVKPLALKTNENAADVRMGHEAGEIIVLHAGTITILDASGNERWVTPIRSGGIEVSPSGQRIVEGKSSDDLARRVWDTKTGRVVDWCEEDDPCYWGAAAAPVEKWDGRFLGYEFQLGAVEDTLWTPRHLSAIPGDSSPPIVLDRMAGLTLVRRANRQAEGDLVNLEDDDGRVVSRFGANPPEVSLISAAGPNQLLVAAGNTVYLWDVERLRVRDRFIHGVNRVTSITSAAPWNVAAWAGYYATGLELWSLDRHEFLDTGVAGANDFRAHVAMTPDGQWLATAHFHVQSNLFQLNGEHLTLRGVIDERPEILQVVASPTRNQFAMGMVHKQVALYDTDLRKILWHYKAPAAESDQYGDYAFDWCENYSFDSDGNRVLCTGGGGEIRAWDARNGQLIAEIKGAYTAIAEAQRPGLFLAGSRDGTVSTFDAKTMTITGRNRTHTGIVRSLAALQNGEIIASVGTDGFLKLRRSRGSESVSLFAHGDAWLAIGEDGVFDASRGGERLVRAIDGRRVYGITQLAAKYNRPDILLERLGSNATDLIAGYREAFHTRLRRAKLDETKLATTLADLPAVSVESIRDEGEFATVIFRAASAAAPLSSYNIYVNGVPLFASPGRPVASTPARIEARIELGPGRNEIEVSVQNMLGAESLRDARTIEREKKKPNLYFLGMGVSHYRDPRFLKLAFANHDVTRMAAVFERMTEAFASVHMRTLVDERVTKASIDEARGFFSQAHVGDVAILYFSGHGLYARGESSSYYFAAFDTDLDRLSTSGISFDEIEALLTSLRPRQRLMLLDTCESGDQNAAPGGSIISSAGNNELKARGVDVYSVRKNDGPAAGSFERDRLVHTDLLRRTGTIIVSSSQGNESAYESERWQSGVFTQAFIEALTTDATDTDGDEFVSTDEVLRFVQVRVAQVTQGLQHPTIDWDNASQTIRFPIVPANQNAQPTRTNTTVKRGCTCGLAGESIPGPNEMWMWLVPLFMAMKRRRR